jgi:hypothetical protein
MCNQIGKKLVASDFRKNRVEDPTQISARQEKQVKKFVKDFFDKAVAKKKERDRKKEEEKLKENEVTDFLANIDSAEPAKLEDDSEDEIMAISDDEEDIKDKPSRTSPNSITPLTPVEQLTNGDGLKRKREGLDEVNDLADQNGTPSKRHRSATPPAPPPPPPPADGIPDDEDSLPADESVFYEAESSMNTNEDSIEIRPHANPMDDAEHTPTTPQPVTLLGHAQHGADVSPWPPDSSGPSSTPRTFDNDSPGGMENLLTERSRYVEAQESM